MSQHTLYAFDPGKGDYAEIGVARNMRVTYASKREPFDERVWRFLKRLRRAGRVFLAVQQARPDRGVRHAIYRARLVFRLPGPNAPVQDLTISMDMLATDTDALRSAIQEFIEDHYFPPHTRN